MFGSISQDVVNLMNHSVHVHGGRGNIYDQVASVREEIEGDNGTRSESVGRLQTSGFHHNCSFRDTRISQNCLDDVHWSIVQQVAHVAIWATNHVTIQGLIHSRVYIALKAMLEGCEPVAAEVTGARDPPDSCSSYIC